MRGADTFIESIFTMRRLDDLVHWHHPLRSIRLLANQALTGMDELFSWMYEADIKGGRPSIAPEKLVGVVDGDYFSSLVSQINWDLN